MSAKAAEASYPEGYCGAETTPLRLAALPSSAPPAAVRKQMELALAALQQLPVQHRTEGSCSGMDLQMTAEE